MPILIIESLRDPHITSVIDCLVKLNVKYILIDPWEGAAGSFLRFSVGKAELNGRIETELCDLRPEDINAVWRRWKPPLTPDVLSLDYKEQEFLRNEWTHFLSPLETFLRHAYWINSREATHRWSNKITQLQAAQKLGLSIPETLVTNSPDRVSGFIAQHDTVIYKPLTYYIDQDKVLYTNRITLESVRTNPGAVVVAPGIFQEEIEKAYELRVTVVEDRIFALKIIPEGDSASRLDWRRNQIDRSYYDYQLDTTLASLLLKFHAMTGLKYAAYDLIVTKNGQPIFLEVNPSGQWLWLELQTGIAVSQAIAEALSATEM